MLSKQGSHSNGGGKTNTSYRIFREGKCLEKYYNNY